MGGRSGPRLLSGALLPYAPQLDGLRAVAVAAVAWSHWMPAWQFGLPFGAGVHLFFVLSGYLITSILLGIAAGGPAAGTATPCPSTPPLSRGRALRHFYVRRALRLFPAFYLTLGLAAWADVPEVRASWPWHTAYLSNIWIVRDADWHGFVSHLWSLGVEEQFYLVWPWVILWTPPAWRLRVVTLAVALGPVVRALGAWAGRGEPFLALIPGGSADSLGLGAWLAVKAATTGVPHGALQRAGLVGLAGWGLLRVLEVVAGPLPVPLMAVRQTLQGLVFLAVVASAARGMTGPAGAVLAHPVTVYVGRISYGVYLAHNFAPLMARGALQAAGLAATIPFDGATRLVLLTAVTLGAASLSWHVVETPVNRLKARFSY